MCAIHVPYSESKASCVNIQLALKLPQAQCSELQRVSWQEKDRGGGATSVCVCVSFIWGLARCGWLRRRGSADARECAADAEAGQAVSKKSQPLPGASFIHSSPLFSVVRQAKARNRSVPEAVNHQVKANKVVWRGKSRGRDRARETHLARRSGDDADTPSPASSNSCRTCLSFRSKTPHVSENPPQWERETEVENETERDKYKSRKCSNGGFRLSMFHANNIQCQSATS